MFDVSFSELFVIAIVALLVIGPEKLPKVARTVGAFTGRMQRYMGQIKEEVSREMRFEELQKLQQEIKHSVEHEISALQPQGFSPQNISSDADYSSLKPSIHATYSPVKLKRVKTLEAKLKDTEPKIAKPKPDKPILDKLKLDKQSLDKQNIDKQNLEKSNQAKSKPVKPKSAKADS